MDAPGNGLLCVTVLGYLCVKRAPFEYTWLIKSKFLGWETLELFPWFVELIFHITSSEFYCDIWVWDEFLGAILSFLSCSKAMAPRNIILTNLYPNQFSKFWTMAFIFSECFWGIPKISRHYLLEYCSGSLFDTSHVTGIGVSSALWLDFKAMWRSLFSCSCLTSWTVTSSYFVLGSNFIITGH